MKNKNEISKVDYGNHPVANFPSLTKRQIDVLVGWYSPDFIILNVEQRCNKLGISKPTFYKWMAQNDFKECLKACFKYYIDNDHSEVLLHLKKKAELSDDPRWMKLYLERFDKEYNQRSQIELRSINITADFNVDKTDLDKLFGIIQQTQT